MTVKTRVDTELGAVIQEATGPLTLAKARAAYNAASQVPGFFKDMPVIWDLRQADLTRGSAAGDIRAMVEHIRAGAVGRGEGYMVVFVVGREVDYGMARKFQAIAATLPHQFLVTWDMDQARRWISGEEEAGAQSDGI